ncbi:MAG: sialidase family protein [Rariglobus sp.]
MRFPFLAQTLFFGLVAFTASTSATAQSTYTWKPVRVGGGGATTTIQAHPKVKNLYFITTDVGTPYRWNATTQSWEGLLYKNAPEGWDNRSAASRLAFDPSDATGNTLYITTGGAWNIDGTILKSVDRGNTWGDCKLLIDVNPNKEQGAGQRIAVDPLNSSVVYVTTRIGKTPDAATNGTFRSDKGGAPDSWTRINTLCGSFVQFDPSKGVVAGVTKTIYLGDAAGVHLSTDGGATFTLMAGSPAKTRKAALHTNGTLYVTAETGVFKLNGTEWANITPPAPGNYSAVALNPANADQVVVSSSSFNPYRFIHYRSKDGGASWTAMPINPDLSEAPWYATSLGQATGSFCWDPFNPTMVWFTDFFFASQTTDIWASPSVTWKPRAAGHEETVTTGTLLSPPSGPNVLHSSMADVGGWDHTSITVPPAIGMMKFFPWTPSTEWGNLSGVAVQETNPLFIARVGREGWDGHGYCGYSADGGKTYVKWKSPADAAGGRIAVSATNETMVWVTQQQGSYRSTDRGTTWTPITTLPKGIIIGGTNIFSTGPRFPLAADKVNGSKFYVYHYGRLHVSTDGGETFAPAAHLPGSYPTDNLVVETTPGKEGHVWVSILKQGLFYSTDSGATFTAIPRVKSVDFMAIGKASPEPPGVPAIYILGKVGDIKKSLFRSLDNGATWTDLGLPAIGKTPLSMAADRQVYGRVFFGTAGNGILYGEPAAH